MKNMKSLIDANVILRYLLVDHPQMSEQSKQIARHRKLGDNVISFDKKLNKMLDMN